MENNTLILDIIKPEIDFCESIVIINEELTQETINLIHHQVSENQLKDFFKWQNIGNLIKVFSKPKDSIIFLEYVLENYSDQLTTVTKHEIYNFLLNQKLVNGDYLIALKLARHIEKTFLKNSINFAFTLTRKGVIYRRLSRFDEALICLQEALDILKTQDQSKDRDISIFTVNNILALIYTDQGKTKLAIDLFKKNLNNPEANNDELSVSICYLKLGFLFKESKNYKTAIDYYLKAQETRKKIGLLKEEQKLNVVLAELYIKDNNIEKAKEYIAICKNIKIEEVKNEAIHLELQLLLKINKSPEASNIEKLKDLTAKSLKLIEETEEVDVKIEKYIFIAKAYEYLKLYKDSIRILNLRHKLFVERVEEQKIASHKQINESQEIQLQHKELERKESLLLQKESLNIKLKHVNDELEEYTYMASHDLKSPLRTILTISGLMKEERLEKEEIDSYLGLIEKDAIKMNKLVNSLLEHSKIGYRNIEMKMISLNELIHEVINSIKIEIENRNAIINVINLPEIKGNEMLLMQLFENLINNALKYNDQNQPEITISIAKNQKSIEVIDNGIGIPENRINEIFKAFTRAHSANQFEGSGVGLATCKKIMNLHSGTISVTSEVGKGSCFTLSFNI